MSFTIERSSINSKSREKIIALLSQDNTLSATALAKRIGIPPKAVEKQIAGLKADGVLRRIGPDKGGYWQVVEKNGLIFLEGAQFAACPLHSAVKKISLL